MSIKYHIIISASVSLILIIIIACQKNGCGTPKGQRSIVSKSSTKVEKNINKIESNDKGALKKVVVNTESSFIELKFSSNLFINSNFKDGLQGWSSTKGVNTFQEDGKCFVELKGQTNTQIRIWQTINTISGHVYRLSFKAKSNQNAAFAIFRDDETKQERYLYTSPKGDWREYTEDFIAYKDGQYRVFFSCHGNGDFYYSNPCIVDKGSQEKVKIEKENN